MEFQLQADLLPQRRPRLMGVRKDDEEEHKENIVPLLAGSSVAPFTHLHVVKRQPLQDITHLIATITNVDTNHNGRTTLSVIEMRWVAESITASLNKKRKATNLSSSSGTNLFNLKRPMLRKSFR